MTTPTTPAGFPVRRRAFLRGATSGALAVLGGVPVSASAAPDRVAAPLLWRVGRPFAQIPIPPSAYRGHAAFPGLVAGPRGTVTLAYRNGTDHVAALDGTLVLANGIDHTGGHAPLAWGNFRTAEQNPTQWGTPAGDLRDPSVSRVAGELWMSWCVGPTQYGALGVFVRRGDGQPVRIDPGLEAASMCAPVVELPDGRLATVFYGRQNGETRVSVWLATAASGATSWHVRRIVHGPALGEDFPEPYLLVRPSGRLVVMHRYGGWAHIGITTSDDGGTTWSTPRIAVANATGRPTTVGVSTGQLLMIYRHPTSRSAMLVVSDDDGATWSPPAALFPSEGGPLGMTYAAMAETRPRAVQTVVASERPDGGSVLYAGELTCL